jgi:hypothetical protein
MRALICVIALATTSYGQSMIETGAAAAGGSVGGVAGKKVGEGLANIFNKVDKAATKASKADPAANPNTPLMEVSPGVPRGAVSVPPPPPLHRAAAPAKRTARVATPAPTPASEVLPAPIALPAVQIRDVTTDDLQKLAAGTDRENVLQLGTPSERITMFDDGHLLEIYRYSSGGSSIGVVRLVDGSVASVQLR